MGLRESEHKMSLMALYFVTMVMRAAFYVTIAVIQSNYYLGGNVQGWEPAAVLVVYPLAELSTVSFFGSYSDKIGRKPILTASLFITGFAALLFAITPAAIYMLGFAVLFGIGAASKVTTTLSMIADCSEECNRARLMGYYDLSTLMGLAGGYGLGILLLQFGYAPMIILLAASSAVFISGFITYFAIGETRVETVVDTSMVDLLKEVAKDKRVQMMLPVYIPIISLYGIVIANTEHILETHFTLEATEVLILFGLLGGSLILGIITMGHLSDHLRKRRPFIITGLISFGILALLIVANAETFEQLWTIWPIIPILGFTAGAFPPAAMAYLTDVSEEDSRGSTMGVYSIFFGSGMIIGPASGYFAYSNFGIPGLTVLVSILIAIACIGTYIMPEAHESHVSVENEYVDNS